MTILIGYNKHIALQNNIYTSDNIRAKISPLYSLAEMNSSTQIYFAPRIEFIWRRMKRISTNYATDFLNTIVNYKDFDTISSNILNDEVFSDNRYDWYVNPIVLMFVNENQNISLRIQAGFEWRYSYVANHQEHIKNNSFEPIFNRNDPNINIFVRAWITEPLTVFQSVRKWQILDTKKLHLKNHISHFIL